MNPGETLLGILGSTDKPPLTIGSGNKETYPFLLGTANMLGSPLLKAGKHGCHLAAYFPLPKFVGVSPHVQSMLDNQVFHLCVSIVARSLQDGCKLAKPMSFGDGCMRLCRTPLARLVVDTPEELPIAGVGD